MGDYLRKKKEQFGKFMEAREEAGERRRDVELYRAENEAAKAREEIAYHEKRSAAEWTVKRAKALREKRSSTMFPMAKAMGKGSSGFLVGGGLFNTGVSGGLGLSKVQRQKSDFGPASGSSQSRKRRKHHKRRGG